MKAVITGMSGTVAPALSNYLVTKGAVAIRWDRNIIPPENQKACFDFLAGVQPDYLFHCASGSPAWAELISRLCSRLGIKLIYTSSVSIYSGSQRGPFTPHDRPNPDDDYGIYKLECEQRILSFNPEAVVVRLGWQIGTEPEKNHMVNFLDSEFNDSGKITASVNWMQACSFLEDTAVCLADTIRTMPGGIYHFDSNDGLNFYQIVTGLKNLLGKPWSVEQGDSPNLNNLLPDDRINAPKLSDRLAVKL
ncbi:MAG: sugar nucleotide-binding protein [Ignavibacteriaceae bacterium]|nr:sugar nucleotide-binding protein [Ignavibacteriaceae bacterium]